MDSCFLLLLLFFLGSATRGIWKFLGLGTEWELQLPAYATGVATWDPSFICDLHGSLRQHPVLNPLDKDRD